MQIIQYSKIENNKPAKITNLQGVILSHEGDFVVIQCDKNIHTINKKVIVGIHDF